jgi:hypothetical protein
LLLDFVATMLLTGNALDVGREVLIGFDLLLVLVLALLLYSISARDSLAAPGRFDRLQLLLVLSALVVDVLALWAIAARISEFGFSPNKTVALGLNILLLVNLGWSAVLYIPVEAFAVHEPRTGDVVSTSVRGVGVDRGGDLPGDFQVPVARVIEGAASPTRNSA